MYEDLKIIQWPDPRLKARSQPVTRFDEGLRVLAGRMLQLMREARGVGLAAPQVGQTIRLFVMNHTGQPEDDRVYVNPVLSEADGVEEHEEGCLSLPGININVLRNQAMRIDAQDLDGNPFAQEARGYVARVWQHETDHLDGVLLLDKMGMVDKIACRKAVKEMEDKYAAEHPEYKRKKKP